MCYTNRSWIISIVRMFTKNFDDQKVDVAQPFPRLRKREGEQNAPRTLHIKRIITRRLWIGLIAAYVLVAWQCLSIFVMYLLDGNSRFEDSCVFMLWLLS